MAPPPTAWCPRAERAQNQRLGRAECRGQAATVVPRGYKDTGARGGVRVSLLIGGRPRQIETAAARAPMVVGCTPAYCDAVKDGNHEHARRITAQLKEGAIAIGLGDGDPSRHGIDLRQGTPVSQILQCGAELGHFLIGEAIFDGLQAAIAKMRGPVDAWRVWRRRLVIGHRLGPPGHTPVQTPWTASATAVTHSHLTEVERAALRAQGRQGRQLRQAIRRQGGLLQGAGTGMRAGFLFFLRDMGGGQRALGQTDHEAPTGGAPASGRLASEME